MAQLEIAGHVIGACPARGLYAVDKLRFRDETCTHRAAPKPHFRQSPGNNFRSGEFRPSRVTERLVATAFVVLG
jgi:hypothetical protein